MQEPQLKPDAPNENSMLVVSEGVRLAHEALSHMFLISAEAFATKNSLPWLSNETKQVVHDLGQSFKSTDAAACATICEK